MWLLVVKACIAARLGHQQWWCVCAVVALLDVLAAACARAHPLWLSDALCPCSCRCHLPYPARRPPTGSSKAGKKRGRKAAAASDAAAAAAAAGDGDGIEDDDDDFMQPRQQRSRRASSSSSNVRGSGPSSAMLADLMKVALDAGVAQLMEMGYSRGKAVDALKECNCDVELAIEYLTAACC